VATTPQPGTAARSGCDRLSDRVRDGQRPRPATEHVQGTDRDCVRQRAVDRGADYSTMTIIRDSGMASGAAGLGSRLPIRTPRSICMTGRTSGLLLLMGTQVDDLGLQQMRALWESLESAPTLTWWASVVSDAGHHAGVRASDIARDSLRDCDSRLMSFLDHLDGLGSRPVTFMLTADHGFERSTQRHRLLERGP